MLHLIGIVMAIGLADSLNPSTVAPALYLASQPRARVPLAQFTSGVFLVYFLGGTLIALGPGELVLSLVPKPGPVVLHLLEVLAGVVLLAVAALLWVHRDRLGGRQLPAMPKRGRANWLLGATIMAFELPTAFPYFAALAAIIASGLAVADKLLLILLFNVCFVMPQLLMLTALSIAGERAEPALARVSELLRRRWPVLLAAVAIVASAITIGLGATATYRAARKLLHHAVIFHHHL